MAQWPDPHSLTCPSNAAQLKLKALFPEVHYFLVSLPAPGAALFSLEEFDSIACCKILLIFYLPTSIVRRTQRGVGTPFESVLW